MLQIGPHLDYVQVYPLPSVVGCSAIYIVEDKGTPLVNHIGFLTLILLPSDYMIEAHWSADSDH